MRQGADFAISAANRTFRVIIAAGRRRGRFFVTKRWLLRCLGHECLERFAMEKIKAHSKPSASTKPAAAEAPKHTSTARQAFMHYGLSIMQTFV